MSLSSLRLPELVALRGNAAEYPENTLPALRSALELGIRYLQIDVQFSADRQPVLLNDASLKRTAGVDRNALEMTWSELAEVPVNEQTRLSGRFTDVGIPSLTQAVGLFESHPDATVFLQLKRATLRAFGMETVARKVCEQIKPIARQCVIVSFDLAAIHHVRRICGYRVGWILSEYSTLSALKCEALAPDYVFCDANLLTQATARLWRGPWRWLVYEVLSRSHALELAARDVRLVATPAVRAMLREFRGARHGESKSMVPASRDAHARSRR